MNRIVLIFLVLFSFSFTGFATHNRAGEITYKHISGFTYEITVTTYTNELSVAADRCELTVVFGDGTSQDVQRTNGVPCPGPGGCSKCGESVGSNNTKMNKYVVTHTYPGNGQYRISMEDPNRNEGVLNIPNSVQVVFYIYAELYIFADGVPNSSPFLSNPPVDDGCIRIPYKHNPGAVDKHVLLDTFL